MIILIKYVVYNCFQSPPMNMKNRIVSVFFFDLKNLRHLTQKNFKVVKNKGFLSFLVATFGPKKIEFTRFYTF
jgi:hypothetical protein